MGPTAKVALSVGEEHDLILFERIFGELGCPMADHG